MRRFKSKFGVRWVMEPGDRVRTSLDPTDGLEIAMHNPDSGIQVRAINHVVVVFPMAANAVSISEAKVP